MPASIADHDRPHAGTASAVPTPIGVAVPITVPEFAPVTIAITIAIIIIPVETARAAEAIVAKLAT
jgi:hypothetical protein